MRVISWRKKKEYTPKSNVQVAAEILEHRAKVSGESSGWRSKASKKRGGGRAAVWKSKDSFYLSEPWRMVRYLALKRDGGRCLLCGSSAKDGIILHVDHIKSRSKHPELQLELSNLQVLCEACNIGKSNRDDTDWH